MDAASAEPSRQSAAGFRSEAYDDARISYHFELVVVAATSTLRTGGMIGSLSHLIRAGAISAIVDGSEAISRELLDEVLPTTQPSPCATAPPDHDADKVTSRPPPPACLPYFR
jgi:hypothetical protein